MVAILVLEPSPTDREKMHIALINAGFVTQAFGERKMVLDVLRLDPKGYALVVADDERFFGELNKDSAFDGVQKISLGKATRGDMKKLVETVVSALKHAT